ncbi:S49 family peptidase [Flavobacterium sp. F-328]|uniref:S49 family peptidase n=1 Tax=Flavobacterium erciyesense TaxID=2825842 RepID=A0ABS5D0C0_9FLAO|nr:S49 family peptidase [Flavobacterium erciyesense]MBQ0907473.1 S49 family peptidase [Flavobacterium erciyesense]
MENDLQSIFASPFYINKEYAQSLLPVLYSAFVLGKTPSKTETEKETLALSQRMASTEGGSGVSAKTVLILSIKTPIQKFSSWEYLGTKSFMSILDRYKNDPNIAGVVLNIDSGGGQVYGTGEFYDYLTAYPLPVVSYTDGYMCSAAYYIGNAAKWIVANKRADAIGSIGAYTTIVDFTGIWEKYGAKVHEFYATKSTGKNADYREVVNNSNYEPYIKNVLDPIVTTFHQDMKATRPGLNEAVFDGSTWGGVKALEMGLIDELGDLQTAIDKVFSLSNLKDKNEQLNNTNNKIMSKTLLKLQATLGLTAALASTDKGTYFNEEQLDLIENKIESLEASESDLKTQLAAAKENPELATAQGTIASLETSVDAILVEAGVTATGTIDEKLTALTEKVTEMASKDGGSHTNVKIDNKPEFEKTNEVGGIDVSAALNN